MIGSIIDMLIVNDPHYFSLQKHYMLRVNGEDGAVHVKEVTFQKWNSFKLGDVVEVNGL